MSESIAIIGARSAGWCAAADLTLRGFDVNLYEEPELKAHLNPIIWRGGIELLYERYHTLATHPTLWFDKVGFAELHRVTTDLAEAVDDVELIVLCVHAYRHADLARRLAPHLHDGQTILISNGMAGELVFQRTLQEMGVDKDLLIAGTGQSLYGARHGVEYGVGENQVITPQSVGVGPEDPRAKANLIAAFPAQDTPKAVDRVDHLWKVVSGANVLQVDLSNPNLVAHLPVCVLSATWIDAAQRKFRMWRECWDSPTYHAVRAAVTEERDAIFEAMGWAIPTAGSSGPPTLEERGIKLHLGPIDFMHRFVHEDAQIGDRLLASLGDMVHVPAPTTKALIHLCATINDIDYFTVGRTVDTIGIAGMSVDDVNDFLTYGRR